MALGGSNSRTFWVYPQGRCSLEELRLLGVSWEVTTLLGSQRILGAPPGQ